VRDAFAVFIFIIIVWTLFDPEAVGEDARRIFDGLERGWNSAAQFGSQ